MDSNANSLANSHVSNGLAKHFFQESVLIAKQRDYLDSLQLIYPVPSPMRRDVDYNEYDTLCAAIDGRDSVAIVESTLSFEKSPFDDPYLSMMRKNRNFIRLNPKQTRRLAGQVTQLAQSKTLLEQLSTPIVANRQMGQCFANWLYSGSVGLPTLSISNFSATLSPAILKASDDDLSAYARDFLGYNRKKKIDLVIRTTRHIIGEAKLITCTGGNQNNQLQDAFDLLDAECNAVKVAVLDGLVYTHPSFSRKISKRIDNGQFILSSLVFNEWLATV